MNIENQSSSAIAQILGERLRHARLNQDLTQAQLAANSGVSRKSVLNAEKGQAQLEVFISIMAALGLTQHLNQFLPVPTISPVQLAKLKGKQRKRASGDRRANDREKPSW